ncbi:MAG: hypothetical protein Q4B78_05230 [Bacillota bacterium]|nr:hypothetical protein [Bacillota bacterium]
MKDILVVSHCILNTASKVAMDESELAEEYMQRDGLIRTVLDKNVQLLQLPCPEFIMYGSRRWGHVRDQFDNPFFRAKCRELLEPIVLQLREYYGNPDKFRIVCVVSVEGSPSCGHRLTCRAEDWGGELGSTICQNGGSGRQVRMTDEAGIYMEELELMLKENNLDIPILSISEAAKRL